MSDQDARIVGNTPPRIGGNGEYRGRAVRAQPRGKDGMSDDGARTAPPQPPALDGTSGDRGTSAVAGPTNRTQPQETHA